MEKTQARAEGMNVPDLQRNPASSLDQEDGGLSHALPSLSRLPATAPGSPTSCLVHRVISFPSDSTPASLGSSSAFVKAGFLGWSRAIAQVPSLVSQV